MESELDLIKKFEAYLHRELSADDLLAFEKERKTNTTFEEKFAAHVSFIKDLKNFGERKNLMLEMDKIHATLNILSLKDQALEKPAIIVSIWAKHKKNLAVAATVAIVFTLVTLLSTGQFKNGSQNPSYSALKRDMESIKRSQNALIRDINSQNKDIAPSQFGGTGFALTSSGYLITNYHVVEGADSVYVQNNKGESFKVKTIYVDPSSDIAVLQIEDPAFKYLSPLPYAFKKTNAEVGEDVYTIGYPKDDVVYGKGYLSSSTGFGGDSIAYQISIPVNPGNSGGPLLDNKGNVIGIVSGKQTQADGAAFAIKSDFLLKAIDNIPQDSLTKKIIINKKNTLASLSRTQQIKKLQDYIFVVKVYNN